LDEVILANMILLSAPLPKLTIRSEFPALPVIFTTATSVNPPLLAMLNVRAPPSKNCDSVRSNVSMPPPPGPPVGLTAGLFALLRTHTFMPPSTCMNVVADAPFS
jgi:hypothetical protein